jgi:hypothetical protein
VSRRPAPPPANRRDRVSPEPSSGGTDRQGCRETAIRCCRCRRSMSVPQDARGTAGRSGTPMSHRRPAKRRWRAEALAAEPRFSTKCLSRPPCIGALSCVLVKDPTTGRRRVVVEVDYVPRGDHGSGEAVEATHHRHGSGAYHPDASLPFSRELVGDLECPRGSGRRTSGPGTPGEIPASGRLARR